MLVAFLLYDGRDGGNDVTFEMMQTEGVFARLVELIQNSAIQEDTRLHQMLLELMYESSRIQRLSLEDLSTSRSDRASRCRLVVPANLKSVSVDDAFVLYLLDIIEGVSNDPNDPYHYTVIRVLVCPAYTCRAFAY